MQDCQSLTLVEALTYIAELLGDKGQKLVLSLLHLEFCYLLSNYKRGRK